MLGQKKVKVSIITPVKNCFSTIKKTIESIKSQTYCNIEHIIVDGVSTDGTLEIIREYDDINLISEPDSSIAEAMNKGINKSTGDLIGILNADDYYSSDTIETVVKNYLENPNSVLHGDMRVYGESNFYDVISTSKPDILRGMVINHPTMFVPKSILMKYGSYDQSFDISGDWELCVRYFLAGIKFKNINKILVHYIIGGASTIRSGEVFDEMHRVRIKHKLFKRFDKRYFRDKFLLLIFGNNINFFSHRKRMILFRIKKILNL